MSMRNVTLCVVMLLVGATGAWAQAVTGFTGGTEYNSYWGGTGDAVGYRFLVSNPLEVSDLGVWNADTAAGGAGMTSPHEVGIWDSTQTLLTSLTVDTSGTVVGDWIYGSLPATVVLNPGETYTIAVVYNDTDNDNYISSAASMTTDPEVIWVESVYPEVADLGLTFPIGSSTSYGRFGPNFLFTVVPVELQSFTIE